MALNLQDNEILKIRNLQLRLNSKYAHRERSEKVISAIESEALEELAQLGWLAHVDAFPILLGEQMTITLLERIDGQEFDHERKAHDVKLARERGETILGESEGSE